MEKEVKINGKKFSVWVNNKFWCGYKNYICSLDEEYDFNIGEDYEEYKNIIGSSNRRKTLYIKRLA